MKKRKAHLGHVVPVVNEARRFGSAAEHEHVWLVRRGKVLPFAFTQDTLQDAHERALNNSEDVPALAGGFFLKLIRKIFK